MASIKQKKCHKLMLINSVSYNAIHSFTSNLIFIVEILTRKRLPIFLTVVVASLATLPELKASIRTELPYSNCFKETAQKYELDSNWLKAIAIVESSLNPKAVSKSNAIGLMQIKWPITATHLGVSKKDSLFDPCTNIDLGGRYLRELTDKYNGDQENALSAYRVGPTTLAKRGSETSVILNYKRKVKEQLAILGGRWPTPPQDETLQARKEKISDSKKIPPSKKSDKSDKSDKWDKSDKSDKSDLPLKGRETRVVQEKDKPREIKPVCDIKALQLATLSTHNPTNREKEFFKWLQRNGSVCSEVEILLVANQLPVWLGTGDSKRIRERVGQLIANAPGYNPT